MSNNLIINVPEERTISMVTVEIKTLQKQAQQVVLGYAIEIGRRLTEAKSLLPHGAWGDWLRDEVEYSKSTANNFMRIFDAYGSDQMGFFGAEAKSQALGNLSYTKALRLLAIPEEEREEFAEAHNVEDISTRELDRLIKERDEARAEKTEALERAAAATEKAEAAAAAQETLQQYFDTQRRELTEKLAAAEQEAAAKAAKADAASANAAQAKADLKAAKDKIKKMKENPEIPEDAMAKIRAEARAEADKAAAEELAAKVKAAEEKQEAAERDARNAREDLDKIQRERGALEKKLALANEDTILFKAEFERFQETFNRCQGLLMRVEINNPDIVPNLKNAILAVLDSMKERV